MTLGAVNLRLVDGLQVTVKGGCQDPKPVMIAFGECNTGEGVSEQVVAWAKAVLKDKSSLLKVLTSM